MPSQVIHKINSYAWVPTRLVTGEWVWLTKVVKIVDDRPMFMGLRAKVYCFYYPDNRDKYVLLKIAEKK